MGTQKQSYFQNCKSTNIIKNNMYGIPGDWTFIKLTLWASTLLQKTHPELLKSHTYLCMCPVLPHSPSGNVIWQSYLPVSSSVQALHECMHIPFWGTCILSFTDSFFSLNPPRPELRELLGWWLYLRFEESYLPGCFSMHIILQILLYSTNNLVKILSKIQAPCFLYGVSAGYTDYI